MSLSKESLPEFSELEYAGAFNPGIMSSHPKLRYRHLVTGRPFIVKASPSQCIRADFVGGKIFSLLGLPAVPSRIERIDNSFETEGLVLIMPDLSGFFRPLSETAGSRFRKQGLTVRQFLTDPAHQESYKDTILAALLIGDYDRVAWNIMVSRDGSDFVNVDFGASLGARARGGFNAFFPCVDSEDIRLTLKDPYDICPNANDLHAEVIEVGSKGIFIKDHDRLYRLAIQMREVLTDDVIDCVVVSARWPDHTTISGRAENRNLIDKAFMAISSNLAYERLGSLGYIKAERASQSYRLIFDEFGCDFDNFFRYALKARRDDLVKLFT